MKKRRLYSSIAALSLFVAAMTFGPLVNGAAIGGPGEEDDRCCVDPGDTCKTSLGILPNFDEC